MKLEEIADVIIGITLKREQTDMGIKYSLLNLKNLENNQDFEHIYTKKPIVKELTKKNDLIFRLVYPNKIIFINQDSLSNLLISSQLCIIRPNEKLVNPVYLKWYLESADGKEQIETFTTGTTIKKISISAIRNLIIPIIPLETQNKISKLITEWDKEKDTLKKIILKKELLYDNIITNKIKEDKNGKES